ncbi:outer membrane lipoprotein chaperone LolA [Gallaecimonas sp. GXIMD4217]|uniref:outer membrane lipoprotein chaperone LolA n=1 Tax=Gallaecimonas sp. GXIMD4217 TaxID=3131927 RepID=UPI00311B41E8
MHKTLIALLLGLAMPASATTAADVLKSRLAALGSFSADFSQRVTDADGNLAMEASGTMAVSRPQKLYWHTQSPDETLLISSGDTLWLYNPFVEQVTLYSPRDAVGRTPMLLLSSQDEAIWAQFRIESRGDDFTIRPMEEEGAYVTALTVRFDGERVEGLTIQDASGQRNEVRFEGFQSPMADNPAIRFEFTPPQGVLVDDQR